MPRLRKLKDYDVTFDAPNESGEDCNQDEISEQNSTQSAEQRTSFENARGERSSGESWLSNASIISAFSDDKLRSSINYYRTMARLLQEELIGRMQGTRTRSVPHEWTGRESQRSSVQTSKTNRSKRVSGRLNKTVKAIAQAINAGLTLEEIHSLLYKED